MRKLILLTVSAALLAACSKSAPPQASQPDLTNLNGAQAVAGEILVKYKGGASVSSVKALSGSRMVQSVGGGDWGTLARVSVPKGQELSYVSGYAGQAGVEYAEPNYWVPNSRAEVQNLSLSKGGAVSSLALPNPITDPYFTQVPTGDPFATASAGGGATYSNVPFLWGIYRVRAPEAWAAGATGAGVVVADIDDGADLTHPDLAPNLWTNPNPSDPNCPGTNGYDFANDDADPTDTNGHGTHTAGTIAAAANGQGVVGVAPEAKLMILKGLGFFGGTNFMLVRALKYAADCGAKVANNSWGGGQKTKAFKDVLEYGTAKGTTYVFSSGNSFRDGNRPSSPVVYSTEVAGVIGVGATSPNNVRTGFSSTGDYVTVAAPGQAILSTIPQDQGNPNDPYAFLQGTSMAAPHVTGVVALLYSAKPGLKPEQVRVALERTANATLTGQLAVPDYQAASAGWYGYGLVDAKAALDYVKANY
ncbi:MAG: peptidase S8 [Meiothermus sp.]